MKMQIALLSCLLMLSGCDLWQVPADMATPVSANGEGQTRPQARSDAQVSAEVAGGASIVPVSARTVEDFDTTSAEERSAARTGESGAETSLGMTIASLGSPAQPGFWLETPLVSAPAKGRVVYPGTGKSVAVDLVPIDGPKTAGSRLSLPAMRLIEAPLTGLPELQVFRSGG